MTRPASPAPSITEHALLRWLERRHGLDIDVFREEILLDGGPALRAALNAGATCRVRAGDYMFAVKGGRLITILHRDDRKAERAPRRVTLTDVA